MDRIIDVTELALRDAHQSLIATRLGIDDMVGACGELDNAGFWSLECWGGATYDACIRFLNEDPWVRLRTFKSLMPKTRLQMLLRGQNLLGYRHYQDEVVDRFVQNCAENGVDVFRIFDALNDLRNLERSVKAVKRAGKHAQGTISYTVSPIHSTAIFVEEARRLVEMGCDSICIKDMAALIKPQAAYDLVRGIKEECGQSVRLHLHVHATTGVTLVSLLRAVEAGVDCVDTAVSSMSLGPGHNPTESFVEMLEGTGYRTTVDLQRLLRVKEHFSKVQGRYSEFLSAVTGVDTEIFKSQIPGGMLSNMENQLRQQGAGERLHEVMEEIPVVRRDTGFVPLVTPTSQIVGTQSVMNVLAGERYKRVTNEVRQYFMGFYGRAPAPVNTDVQAKVVAAGETIISGRPADSLPPELEKAKAEIGDLARSEEDVISYAIFPQVARDFFEWRNAGEKPEPAMVAAIAAVLAAEKSAAVAPEQPSAPISVWRVDGRRRGLRAS
jgi:methylmalonyl-CoA carboxyltransferase 5S subunit